MTYRDETESLRAEVKRLHAEVAEGMKPATRWDVARDSAAPEMMSLPAALALAVVLLGLFFLAVGFVVDGGSPIVQRGAMVCAAILAVWALCFVRRVPR